MKEKVRGKGLEENYQSPSYESNRYVSHASMHCLVMHVVHVRVC